MSTVRINPLTGFPEVMPDTRGGGIMSGLGSPFASSIREAALVGNRERVDPYKGTKFEGFTGLGNDGYGSLSQGPMDNVLSDGFFVNDPRRPRPGMRGSSTSNIPAVPLDNSFSAGFFDLADKTELTNVPPMAPSAEMIATDMGPGGMGKIDFGADFKSSLKNILADRNLTPEERGALVGPGKEDLDKADFYAFKNTLRDPGDMGRYVAPGEEMSYEDFVKFGRPANLAAAEAAGYGGGALLVNDFGNKVSLGSLIGATPGASEVPSNPSRPISYDPNAPVDPGFSPNLVDPYARPTPGMLPQPIEINPNYRPDNFRPNPNMFQRPMRRPFGFGGRPMNPFMGMGIGMMNPMGMGMFGGFPMRPPMFGGYGGYGGGYGGYGGGYNMMRPPMGFGLGGANPYGMNPYSNFGRPNPYPQPSYNMPNPYSSGMNIRPPSFGGGQPSIPTNPNHLYDANMRPIPGAYADPNRLDIMQQQPQYNNMYQQQQGGYGSYQQPSGYGNYGGMQNPYQPQQMGNTNNFAGYGQQQAMF